MINREGGIGEEVSHRVMEEEKGMRDDHKNIWKENMTYREVKRELYER